MFATLSGERHELGLLMSAMVSASHGFKVHYLGPDLPAQEIARYAREVGAGAVTLSVVVHEQLPGLPAQVHALADALPPQTAIWIGGAACRALDARALPERCTVMADPAEFEQRLEMYPG